MAQPEGIGTRRLLGGQSPASFLRRFWQKEALLIRGALPDWTGIFTREELQALAGQDDVESRLVVREQGEWSLEHGPFRKSMFRALGKRNWTLLVQGTNLHVAAADALLRRFAFLPYARFDDLMVSFAAPGGGVGPHIDSYDVFLLQGEGRRRWRYGNQAELALRPGLPLKILQRFAPQHDAVLGSGDMLYLPPNYAHDGVALEPCLTYSIGFRAPSHDELAQGFLDYLRDGLALPGRYSDPGLAPTAEPARIAATMQRRAAQTLAEVRWNGAMVARFLGAFLSTPKADVYFSPPDTRLTPAMFRTRVSRHGIALDRRTQWLYDDLHLFINGDVHPWPRGDRVMVARLANNRALAGSEAAQLTAAQLAFVHTLYGNGFLHPA